MKSVPFFSHWQHMNDLTIYGFALLLFCLIVLSGVNVYFGRQEHVISIEIEEPLANESTAITGKPTKDHYGSSTLTSTQIVYLDEREAIPADCVCTDSYGQAQDFCYHLPENKTVHGRRFSCEHMKVLDHLGLLNTSHIPFAIDLPSPVFVTAFSISHQHEALYLVDSIAKRFPKQRVVVYDLGDIQKDLFEAHDFLEFRSFNFSQYPTYVTELEEYRWKPIIIAETLAEFGAIWYMDSSVVFEKSDLSHVHQLINCRNKVHERPPLKSVAERDQRENLTKHESGWDVNLWKENLAECRKAAYLMHSYTGHGIYPATSPVIYDYIPTNFTEIKKPKAKMYEAGFIFAVRTKDTIERILKWYVLCALEEGCMAGNHHEETFCFFGKDRFATSPRCHRYDQSVVNLLAANAFWYDRHYYVSEIVDFFNIHRVR